ncbi:hypothetical protein QM450_00820 [Streptococcus infantis]|uniref:hypothetical protein n=1 Tax=Streptococcus infantis TaxID=68892 RepID=UPI0039C2CFAF
MSQEKLIDSYEELLAYVEEIGQSLDLLHEWLSIEPKFEDYWSYHDLIAFHGQYFALLNLIRFRIDSLSIEHRDIIKKTIKVG